MIDVIHNPVAGPKVVKRIDRVRAYLSARGLPFRIRETAAPGDAVVMAREAALAGADVVVAVGGDGTMNEVADGLAGSATRLAFVPHGTGNVFAREFSLPGSVEGCLDLLSSGKTISVRMAKANDRRFVLLASAGFDAEVVERMNSRQKNLLGIAAYVLSGARHLLRSQPTLWLEFPDRERIEAQAVIVARGKKYGGNVTIAPGGDITGETFQVIALLRKGRWSIAKFALDALRGKHVASRHVLIRESPSLFVRCPIPSACQVDGEYLGPLPVRFTVTDALLQVVVPAGFPPPAVPAMKNSKVCNVLFLCTGNSARSILAEALVGRLGEGRFRGYSAGSHPKGAVHPLALELLLSLGYPTEGYRSKGWEEFSRPGAPELDFVFTVCDDAAGETCPVWPGSPVTAHWGVPDPAAAEGDELTRRNAFRSTYRELENRIRLFCEGVSVPRNPL